MPAFIITDDKGNDFFDLELNWVSPQNNAGMEMGVSGSMIGGDSGLPQTYTCAEGDTYESIASNLYGDASLGSYIDAANGGGTLIAGQTIVIPQLISVHNKAGMARPYYQFLQAIQGPLYPHLDTPQPPPQDDDDFFGFLFKAVVIAVICVAVPELAPELVAGIAETIGVSQAVVTVVGVGLADAAAQGLCIGLGIQDHFSMAELAIIMITTGFGAQLPPLSADATAAELMEFVVRAGVVNVEEQLAEMAIGVRQQFDLAGVALAMGSAGLSPKIKLDNPLAQRMVSDIAVAGMTSVVRGRFEVENLAAQLLTDMASYVTHQQIKSISEDYHQSQKASRGAGQITQTTIDQQWESQLINDAEFTAHTQLPSIAFDVNNSYVSQQLGQRIGEEVSHFYHPTPTPPRNPSGFWRGVDNVLEMREGTRKAADLIFTGHYETPKNRWQEAGYAIGVPLAFGAQIVMAGERLGAEAVGAVENIYQGGQRVFGNVTSKLQRWGLFGHNGIENTAAFGRGVTFFSKDYLHFFAPDTFEGSTALGLPAKQIFLMPEEDAIRITSPVSAAIETGFAPSLKDAWLQGKEIFGASFPTKGLSIRLPTAEDALGNVNFRLGGNTAIRVPETDTFLVNQTREFVTPGGIKMPPGTIVFRLGEQGDWIPYWRFK